MRSMRIAAAAIVVAVWAVSAQAEPAPMQVKLLSPGAEPREALRYAPQVGQPQKVTTVMRTKTTTEMNGRAMPMPDMPGMSTTVEIIARHVDDAGNILVESKTVDAKMAAADADGPPQMAEHFERMVAALKGSVVQTTMTNRGIPVGEPKVTLAPGADPKMGEQMASSMQFNTLPLPEEPIGIGAEWEVIMSSGGGASAVQMQIHMTIKLDERDGDVLKVSTTLRSNLEPSATQPMAMSMTGTGKGEMRLDRLGVLSAQQQMRSHGEMDAGPQGKIVSDTKAQVKVKTVD